MGRLVRIFIYALIILILYFWVMAIMKQYQKNKKSEIATEVPTSTENNEDTDTISVTNPPVSENEKMITNQDIVDGNINYKEVDNKVKELEENRNKPVQPTSSEKPAKKPTVQAIKNIENTKSNPVAPSPTTKNVATKGGKYILIAGSYLLKENANKMVKKLKALGYSNAEVVIFNASEYHSVIADKFASEGDAIAEKNTLKQKGIDTFVKK